jgi:hypothetical protein
VKRKKETPTKDPKTMTAKEVAAAEAEKKKGRDQVLEDKVRDYKRQTMQDLIRKKTKDPRHITLWVLLQDMPFVPDGVDKDLDKMALPSMEEILKVKPQKLDELITTASLMYVYRQDFDNRDIAAAGKAAKVDLAKDWKIDQKYTELMTGPQIQELVKELKLKIPDGVKKVGDLRLEVVAAAKKGMVPKILQKK